MPLTILKYPDPSLSLPSEPVTEVTPELRQLAAEMADAMYRAEGIGLAAPQVGRRVRLIVVDVTGPEERKGRMVLINPRLTPVEDEGRVESEEGCLSVHEYRSKVKRYAKVRLEAQDLDGNAVDMEAEGLLSVCLQHEVDHLDGKLFIDHISRLKRTLYDGRVKKWLRESREPRL